MIKNLGPGDKPGLPDWMRDILSTPEPDYYTGPSGGYHRTPRGAAEENAAFEESFGRSACNRNLDNPDWGNDPGGG